MIIYRIIKLIFGVEKSKLDKIEIFKIYSAFGLIKDYIEVNIHNKFTKIANVSDEEVDKNEGISAFDEIDKEYEEENKDNLEENNINIFDVYKDILNYNIKYSIELLKNSYKESVECNLIELLDFIYFNKKITIKDNKENDDVY